MVSRVECQKRWIKSERNHHHEKETSMRISSNLQDVKPHTRYQYLRTPYVYYNIIYIYLQNVQFYSFDIYGISDNAYILGTGISSFWSWKIHADIFVGLLLLVVPLFDKVRDTQLPLNLKLLLYSLRTPPTHHVIL